MLNLLLLLSLLAVGTAALWLVAWGCYIGGAWLGALLWRRFFEER
jgi:hypothetical protein